jgi:hypothetical protein
MDGRKATCGVTLLRPHGMGDILGYARVSTSDQDVAGQTMRLTQAAAIKVFTDVRSGRTMDRPGLDALLAYARKGDTLAVVRLDRLGPGVPPAVPSTVVAGLETIPGARGHFYRLGRRSRVRESRTVASRKAPFAGRTRARPRPHTAYAVWWHCGRRG